MSLSTVQATNNSRIGTCPHGLPLGACPICNGMGGGAKKADFSAKPGEMSWNECAAIGAFLKAQKMAKLQRQQDVENFAKQAVAFDKAMMNASQKTQVPVVKTAFVPFSVTGEKPAIACVARLCGVSPYPVPDTATALPNQARYQLRYTRICA